MIITGQGPGAPVITPCPSHVVHSPRNPACTKGMPWCLSHRAIDQKNLPLFLVADCSLLSYIAPFHHLSMSLHLLFIYCVEGNIFLNSIKLLLNAS